MSLHVKKIQFYGCKHVFYFDEFWKIPLGKFPPEKNPPENISDNFVKFRKFFLTEEDFRKFRGKCPEILIIKSIIYRLYTIVYILLSRSVSSVSGNLRETFRTFFCHVTNLSQRKVQRFYISEKYKFTAVNMCFISPN